MMNGGYLMVSKTDTNLYEKLNNALTLGKPVLFYEDENTCYYIDAITKSGTDIILTKGGKTITIESDGDITESGNVQDHLYEYVFIDDNGYTCFRALSSINCDVSNTDENWTQDEIKSLHDLVSDITNTGDDIGYTCRPWNDEGVSYANAKVNNHTIYITNVDTNVNMIEVAVDLSGEGVYSIINDTGYLYIKKRQLF